jgi:hypothetical protein
MIYDLRTEKQLVAAETKKSEIENKGKTPIVKCIGVNKIRITEQID